MRNNDRWLRDWDGEPWRKPDKAEDFTYHLQAVWYSAPFGGKYGSQSSDPQESQTAVSVELSEEAFIVTEYTHVSEWYMDEPWDADEHGDFWRTQSVELDPAFVRKIVFDSMRGSPAKRRRFTREMMARYAAGIGVAYISYYGGGDDEVESLP